MKTRNRLAQLKQAGAHPGPWRHVDGPDEQNVEIRDVGIGRHEIAGEVPVEKAGQHRIGLSLPQKHLPDAPDDAADGLAARRLAIDDMRPAS